MDWLAVVMIIIIVIMGFIVKRVSRRGDGSGSENRWGNDD